jgi:flagellar hook-associated protein 1 FlgK
VSSSFSGLINASASLGAQRYGLDVTGQNIANSDTDGYTRQRADMAAVGAVPGVPSLYATQGAATGVTVSGTSRINDPVLDARARTEHGRNGYAQTASTQLSGVQTLFDEPSDTGLSEQLSSFWNAWSTVSNDPSDDSARSVVLEDGASLAATLNTTSNSLATLTQSASDQLNETAVDINTAATGLAQINAAIAVASATGANANSLFDQRDSLLLQLSDNAGVSSTLQSDGTVSVTLGGQSLVTGNTASTVAVTASNSLTVGGTAIGAAGGTAQGLIDSLTTTLPGYAAKLDTIASTLASTVNTAHQAGYDLSGNAGGAFFSGTTASTIAVAITNPSKVAASGVAGGNLDASVAAQLGNMGTISNGADDQYTSLVSTLGSDVQKATQTATVQASVTTSVDTQVEAMSGVSLDEETTNMLTYQRAYQASSRVLTTVDDMLDQLINHTGRAGL